MFDGDDCAVAVDWPIAAMATMRAMITFRISIVVVLIWFSIDALGI